MLHGLDKELMFRQCKEQGRLGLSDFTELSDVEITVDGDPLGHTSITFASRTWLELHQCHHRRRVIHSVGSESTGGLSLFTIAAPTSNSGTALMRTRSHAPHANALLIF